MTIIFIYTYIVTYMILELNEINACLDLQLCYIIDSKL